MPVYMSVLLALAAWAVAIFKFNAVRRNIRRAGSRRIFGLWLFSVCFALSLTHLIPPVYLSFDALVGLNNLSWLAAYVYLALGIYCLAFAGWLLHEDESKPWPLRALICTLALLLALFLTSIRTSPEWPNHDIPRNNSDLLFMLVFYLYAITVGTVPVIGLYRAYRKEQSIPTRLRFLVGFLSGAMAISFFVAKTAYILYAYPFPSSEILQRLIYLPSFLMATSGLLATTVFLPAGLYRRISQGILHWGKLTRLRDLKVVECRLNRLCPSVTALDSSSWWDRARDVDFFIYRSVIAIQDMQRTLSAVLDSGDPTQGDGSGGTTFGWQGDGAALEEAAQLRDVLREADKQPDFEGLVAFYAEKGKTLRADRGMVRG